MDNIKFENGIETFSVNTDTVVEIKTFDSDGKKSYLGKVFKINQRNTAISIAGFGNIAGSDGKYPEKMKEFKVPCEVIESVTEIVIDEMLEKFISTRTGIASRKDLLKTALRVNNSELNWTNGLLEGMNKNFPSYNRLPVVDAAPMICADGKTPKRVVFNNGSEIFNLIGKGIETITFKDKAFIPAKERVFVGEIFRTEDEEETSFVRIVGYFEEEPNNIRALIVLDDAILSATNKLLSQQLKSIINMYADLTQYVVKLENGIEIIQGGIEEEKNNEKILGVALARYQKSLE